jgi:hypothetical protein
VVEQSVQVTAIKRVSTPDDVVGLVMFLSGDAAALLLVKLSVLTVVAPFSEPRNKAFQILSAGYPVPSNLSYGAAKRSLFRSCTSDGRGASRDLIQSLRLVAR